MPRKPIRKSVRFEVFKRDSFTCQYCGQKSPDVVLVLDHITPVASGGDNDLLNLITACHDCNAGKSDKKLSELLQVAKRRNQLESLEEGRQQVEMLHEWHMSQVNLADDAIKMAERLWRKATGLEGDGLTQPAELELRKLVKKYGFDELCVGIREAAESANRTEGDRYEVCNIWFWKIARILNTRRLEEEMPGLSKLFYIRGILRNRIAMYGSGDWQSIAFLKQAHGLGVPMHWMEEIAKKVTSWSQWRALMEDAISSYGCPPTQEDEEEATDGQNP